MLRRFSVNFAIFSICLDMTIILVMLTIATQIRPLLNDLPYVVDIPGQVQIPTILYMVFPVVWVMILQVLSLYDGRRNLLVIDEIISLTIGSLVGVVALAGVLYLSYRDVSRALFLSFAFNSYLGLIAWRLVYRIAYRIGWLVNIQPRRILLVGAGPVGREMEEQIRHSETPGLQIVGFVDDDTEKQSSCSDILGDLDDVIPIVIQYAVDDVVVALPARAYQKVSDMVTELHTLPVKVWVIPDYYHLALHKAVVEDITGIPLLDLRAPALTDYQRFVKRAFDLIVTLSLLPLSLMMMAIIAVFIWLEDRGPILFKQMRVGENGKLFEMLKFRSMCVDAEAKRYLVMREDSQGQPLYKVPNDPRVTKVGYWLRRSSLDELPQIFNILKGEMSLVGPRPELPDLVEKYEVWQRKRFTVPQGLTGWWQINGRSDKPMHLHTEDDLYYVQNYSLLLDMRILLKTIGTVVRRKGAF